MRRFERDTDWLGPVAFSPDSVHLAAGETTFSDNYYIHLWEVPTGQEVRRFEGHTDDVTSVAFSPDGTHLASGANDNTVRLWEVAVTNTTSEASPSLEISRFTHYPNPAESFITIEYALLDASEVKLSVRDLLGREVVNVLNTTQPAGSHRLQLSTEQLPGGVYFLRLVTDGEQTARPLVVH